MPANIPQCRIGRLLITLFEFDNRFPFFPILKYTVCIL